MVVTLERVALDPALRDVLHRVREVLFKMRHELVQRSDQCLAKNISD